MNKVSKIFALSSLSLVFTSPLTSVSAENWWEQTHKYKISVKNIEPTPNQETAIVVFFKDDYYSLYINKAFPVVGEPSPQWLKDFVRDGTPPEDEDICKAVEVNPAGEIKIAEIPWNCSSYVAIQRGRSGETPDPQDHFNGELTYNSWGYGPLYGQGYNLGDPTPGYIYSQALKDGKGVTVETLEVNVNYIYDWNDDEPDDKPDDKPDDEDKPDDKPDDEDKPDDNQ